ncbi:hypothetical protein NM688_g2605 [Phlebia brevispora]|uniref:Uncharacterized protein n=1 Tax=Phlebia brevispora TaxID=194682 RepID=A0ACC1T8E1_9APHY|nr:hypothetical protein NM688_g2605 [Phlebia brevispora]
MPPPSDDGTSVPLQSGDSFRGVEDDAAAWTVSDSTSSSESASYGLGYLSGKWIQLLGEKALRGAERMSTGWKLRKIEADVRTKVPSQWQPDLIKELLEYQRVDFVYPDNVRRAAWDLIFVAMERKGWLPLTEALGSWNDNYLMEERWFIQQLAICKLSDWSSHPVRDKIRVREPLPSPFQLSSAQSTSRSLVLTESLAHILLYAIDRHPSMIHEAFSLDTICRILANGISPRASPYVPPSLFFDSFASLHPFPDIPSRDVLFEKLPGILETYPAANCLIQYLCTAPMEKRAADMKTIVDYIVDAIRPFAAEHLSQRQTETVLRRHPYLRSPQVVNPTWPFLCFAVLLTWHCADATHMFICAEIIDILNGLCHRYRDMPMCFLYIALLNTLAKHQDLSNCTLKKKLEDWSAGKPRRKSTAKAGKRPGSSGSQMQPLSVSPQPMTIELPPESGPSSRPSISIPDPELPPPGLLFRPAALFMADLTSRPQIQNAPLDDSSWLTLWHWHSELTELLVEVMKLKTLNGRPSKSAKVLRKIYDTYMARISVLCQGRTLPIPPPPTLPPTSPASPAAHGRSASSSSGPPPPEVPSSMDALRQRNDELFEVWRADMIPRTQ